MADLSAEKREDLPAKDFGLPEKARTKDAKKESGNYPHARQGTRPQRQGARGAAAEGRKPQQGREGADRPQGGQEAGRVSCHGPARGPCPARCS